MLCYELENFQLLHDSFSLQFTKDFSIWICKTPSEELDTVSNNNVSLCRDEFCLFLSHGCSAWAFAPASLKPLFLKADFLRI